MITWHVEVGVFGQVTQDQVDAIAEAGGFGAAYFTTAGDAHRVELTVAADTYDQATRAAVDAVAHLPLPEATTVEAVTVQTERHRDRDADTVTPGEFATLLGVSDARLRQLRGSHAAFPRQLPGGVYRRADAEAFAGLERRGGRPRKAA